MKNKLHLLICSLFLITSCEKEPYTEESYNILDQKLKIKNTEISSAPVDYKLSESLIQKEEKLLFENLRNRFLQDDPSACQPTEFEPVARKYLDELMSDPVAGQLYSIYINLNRTLALKDTEKQYFGKDGEYTRLMEKRIRELERFWDMQGELSVKGQHTETLNDREKLAAYFYSISFDDSSWDDAYLMADHYIENNEQSPFLPESPLIAGDGFTNYNNQMIIGDGLVQILSETGIEPEIIWTGILAHEWSHQIQIDHADSWYNSVPPFTDTPIIQIELESDFFAAFFLTHKRGATYNWKDTEQFLYLFFQSGDCALDNPLHHGTPAQRLHASRLGFELAESLQKKGHILTPDQVHEAFNDVLPKILNGQRN